MTYAYAIFDDGAVTAIALSLDDAKAAVAKFKQEDPKGHYFYLSYEVYTVGA